MIRTLAAALLVFTATAPMATAEPVDPWALHIDIGRYGAMMGQIGDMTDDAVSMAPEAEIEDARTMMATLRQSAWRYNLQRASLCARGLYTAQSCGRAYAPAWLGEDPNARPSLSTVERRATDLGDRVMALWDAVCADAKAHATSEDEMVCPME